MQEPNSVTHWIAGVKSDSQEAAQRLYERYLLQLAAWARVKLEGTPRRAWDEEDVAHAALTGFFAQVRKGSFPQLDNRYDLWQVLIIRKIWNTARHAGRGLGWSESDLGAGARETAVTLHT